MRRLPTPWSRNTFSPIGLDLGADRIKLLQLEPGEPGKVAAAACAERPAPRTDKDGPQIDDAAWQVDTLRRLCREGGFSGRRVIASLPAFATRVQPVRLGGSEADDDEQRVLKALREHLPVAPSQLLIRLFPVGDVVGEGSGQREVICIVARRAFVQQQIALLGKAGLTAAGIYAEPLAVAQALAAERRREADADLRELHVDIGARQSKVLIAHGASMVFAKSIEVGAKQLALPDAAAMARGAGGRVGVEHADAGGRQAAAQRAPGEGRLRRANDDEDGGLAMIEAAIAAEQDGAPNAGRARSTPAGPGGNGRPHDSATPAPAPDDDAATAPAEAAQPNEMLDCLVDELQLCVGYHAALFGDEPLDRLVLMGGCAAHPMLTDRLSTALRLEVAVADPLGRLGRTSRAKPPVGVDLRTPQPGWVVPFGLCRLPANL